MEIKLLAKENLDRTLEENGKLVISKRTVWKEDNVPLDEQEHILVLLELYELRDMGKVKIDECDHPEWCACATGKEELEGYLFCVFGDYMVIDKKIRALI